MLFFVLAEAVLCWREHDLRLSAEEKMRMAYLELNDMRGGLMLKSSSMRRSASELRELREKNYQLERENVEKELKISELTKRLHQ